MQFSCVSVAGWVEHVAHDPMVRGLNPHLLTSREIWMSDNISSSV